MTLNIAFAAALYKKLVTATEAYVGEAPIIHQAVALKTAIDARPGNRNRPSDVVFVVYAKPDSVLRYSTRV